MVHRILELKPLKQMIRHLLAASLECLFYTTASIALTAKGVSSAFADTCHTKCLTPVSG